MAYLITKTDGNTLTTVADGQIDDLSTGLTLVGKNYSGFGEALNENFIKLLENFAGSTIPSRAIRGQIWFDTTERKLKVYNGTVFQPVSSATISNTQPSNLSAGDLWFNDIDKQLYFYDGINPLLLGPSYSTSQGISGFRIQTIIDNLNQSRTITALYTNGNLLGIFSKDAFTPKIPIEGFVGSIIPGFNQANIDGFKFVVTSTNSEKLGGIPADTYIKADRNGEINGALSVIDGLFLGEGSVHQILYDNGNLLITNAASNKVLTLSTARGRSQEDSIRIEPETRSVKIYDGYLDSTLIAGGNLEVVGNLTVQGSLVTIRSETLVITDKNIELGATTVPTDFTADAGGIILKGTTNKLFTWSQSADAWTSSENLKLASDKKFYIGDTALIEIIEGTSPPEYRLTTAVTQANGIEIFGTQAEFQIRNVFITDNKISTVNDTLPDGVNPSNIDLEIETQGSGNVVLLGSPKIQGVGEPVGIQDAATKNYVDTQLKSKSLVFTFDISDGISNSGIAGWIEQIAPAEDYLNNTVARVLCTSLSNATATATITPTLSKDTFLTSSGSADAVIGVTIPPLPIPAAAIIVTRVVKLFQIVGGSWTFIS